MKVHIVQLLCPSRHCLAATAYEPQRMTSDQAIAMLRSFLDRALSAHCGICGSPDLHYEDGETRFATLEEAMPALKALQEANLNTRALLDAAGVTFDSKPKPPEERN